MVIVSSATVLQEMVEYLMDDEFERIGMKVNIKKTKVMVMERDVMVTVYLVTIGEDKLEQVHEFRYLGSVFVRDDKCEKDIESKSG